MDVKPLCILHEFLEIKRPPHNGVKNAHVMFVGPVERDESEENMKLRAICGACLILLSNDRYSVFWSLLFLYIKASSTLLHSRTTLGLINNLFIQASLVEESTGLKPHWRS